MESELNVKKEESSRTAEDLCDVYYTHLDNHRFHMHNLYLDNGLLLWNGNGITRKLNIQKFFDELPSSEHFVTLLDAHLTQDAAVGRQVTYIIQVGGLARYAGQTLKPFQQTLIMTAQEGNWKIVSDAYHLEDTWNDNN